MLGRVGLGGMGLGWVGFMGFGLDCFYWLYCGMYDSVELFILVGAAAFSREVLSTNCILLHIVVVVVVLMQPWESVLGKSVNIFIFTIK